MSANNYTWGGRFSQSAAESVQKYTASVLFDQRMWQQDIRASLAHARMLARQKIISAEDCSLIENGLAQITDEIISGKFVWQVALEDVHFNIEKRLTELVGDAGKRLHTGRSRNDQVATDIRLWLRDAVDKLSLLLLQLQQAIVTLAKQEAATAMPGFTHLQVAQPITFGHHLLAYFEMFKRDFTRLKDCRQRLNYLPLGAAALAGTSYPIDRASVAAELGFAGVCENSLDAVSDRDFAIEFASATSMIMLHLSRLSEELVLWMNPRFAFVNIPDAFCTGSSIMPQKKNPDVPELARGKSGRVFGNLFALLTLMKAQVLAYNKDNQEDKEPIFDSFDQVRDTLEIFVQLFAGYQQEDGSWVNGLSVNHLSMRDALHQGYATATDLADYLVRSGLPFRDAHDCVGQIVRFAEEKKVNLAQLSLEQLQQFSSLIKEDIFQILTIEGSLASRDHIGGTAPEQVKLAALRAENFILQTISAIIATKEIEKSSNLSKVI